MGQYILKLIYFKVVNVNSIILGYYNLPDHINFPFVTHRKFVRGNKESHFSRNLTKKVLSVIYFGCFKHPSSSDSQESNQSCQHLSQQGLSLPVSDLESTFAVSINILIALFSLVSTFSMNPRNLLISTFFTYMTSVSGSIKHL